jgi:hypothetical protein
MNQKSFDWELHGSRQLPLYMIILGNLFKIYYLSVCFINWSHYNLILGNILVLQCKNIKIEALLVETEMFSKSRNL